MTWEPILDGELAERAWVAIRELADALATAETPPSDAALIWTYLSSSLDDDKTTSATETALTNFARSIEAGIRGPALWGGLAGAGWIANHVADDVDAFLEVVDAALLEALSTEPWVYDYDLISGLVGMAVYFLDRTGDAATTGLARIVEQLDATSERRDGGITWHTRPELLPEFQREASPQGYFNCGLAHGVPGCVAILAKIAARSDAPTAAARLADGAVTWLAAQIDKTTGTIPTVIDGGPSHGSRDAWCYGIPGAAAALRIAGVYRGPVMDYDTLDGWLQRPFEKSGVVDTALCHGSVGLAHIANRFYQATGKQSHRDGAIRWYERALAMRKPGEPLAGFPQYAPPIGGKTVTWNPSSHLLDGAGGVALGLLAAVTPIEPEWDRLLLTDLPVRA